MRTRLLKKYFLRSFTGLFFVVQASLNAGAQNFDTRMLRSINSQSAHYDKFWLGFTHSAAPVALATPLGLFGMGYYHYIPSGKKHAFAAVGALAINTALTVGVKFSVRRERPFVNDPYIYKKAHAGPQSFPSGHTSLAFTTATTLTLAYPRWYVALPAFAWAGAVGYSRMHLGMHYPSDVLAGAITGSLSSFVAYKLNEKLNKRKNK